MDLYQVGTVLYLMLMGFEPFHPPPQGSSNSLWRRYFARMGSGLGELHSGGGHLYHTGWVVQDARDVPTSVPWHHPPEVFDFVSRLLSPDSSVRIAVYSGYRGHAFFAGVDWEMLEEVGGGTPTPLSVPTASEC